MMNTYVNYKWLNRALLKGLLVTIVSAMFFVLFAFTLSIVGIMAFNEPIQQIIFFGLLAGNFCLVVCQEYIEQEKQAMRPKISVNIVWSEKDGFYHVNIPEFVDIVQPMATGKTLHEAFNNAEEVIREALSK